MSRNTLAILYGTLAVLAIALGLFVANLFGTSPATPADTTNSIASASARTTVPPATAAPVKPTSAPATTSAPTDAPATAAPAATEVPATPAEPTAAPTDAPVEPTAAPTDVPVEPTAAPAEPTVAPTAEAAFIEYTVQRGDSLKNIAQRYNTTVAAILAINKLSDPDNLTVGDVIRIPRS